MDKYYLAPALRALRAEVNRAHPNRDTRSDGWLGDASHAARKSDHNPDYSDGGVVRALDIDKDGINMSKLLSIVIKDSRVNYAIWAGYIYSRAYGFKKRVYTGTNKHYSHMHISLRHGRVHENSTKAWGYSASTPSTPSPKPQPTAKTGALVFPVLQRGSKGQMVRNLQGLLNAAGRRIAIDGDYGYVTETTVKRYQQAAGLAVDGKAGTDTFRALLGV